MQAFNLLLKILLTQKNIIAKGASFCSSHSHNQAILTKRTKTLVRYAETYAIYFYFMVFYCQYVTDVNKTNNFIVFSTVKAHKTKIYKNSFYCKTHYLN